MSTLGFAALFFPHFSNCCMCRVRALSSGLGGGNDEREQTLNQLLVEMDGFDTNEGVIMIAATNRPDVLDPALLRPGRFDRQVVVGLPDIIGREKVLKVHVKKIKMAPDVNLRTEARATPGFSGADLANIVNEAALLAARKNKRIVTLTEFEESRDKVMIRSSPLQGLNSQAPRASGRSRPHRRDRRGPRLQCRLRAA